MPTIQEVTQDPEFKAWPREKQLYMLGKADPEFGTYEPEKQNYFIDKFVKDEHKPEPLTHEDVIPEKKSFLGEFTDKFQPTSFLKNFPEITGNALHEMNPKEHPENYLFPGVAQVAKAGAPIIENIINRGRDTLNDAMSPMEGYDKLLSAAKNSIKAVPVLGESMRAGERMIPPSGDLNWNASGSMVGDLANAALPKAIEPLMAKIAQPASDYLRNSGARNIQNILKAGSDKAGYAHVEDLSNKIMGGQYDMLAPTDEALLEKLANQKTARSMKQQPIEQNFLRDHPVRQKYIQRALEPLDDLEAAQGKAPLRGSTAEELADSARDVRSSIDEKFSTQIPEDPAIPGKMVYKPDGKGGGSLSEEGGSPGSPAARVSKDVTGKDLLEIRRQAAKTAREKNAFKPGGPGYTTKISSEGKAWKAGHKGAQTAIEDIVNEAADTNENNLRQGNVPKGSEERIKNSIENFRQYGPRNKQLADLIDLEENVGRQKTIGTAGIPKYVLQRMGSAFGLRAAGAEEASRLAGSTGYQSGMAYSKKTLADMLMGQGMPENVANAAALKIITANQSR